MIIYNEAALENRIRALRESPWRTVISCTGAGAGIQLILWNVAGASATVLRCGMEYDRIPLQDYIECEPEKYCSLDTALAMAAAAYRSAEEIAVRGGGDHTHLIGIGLTAAVATTRPKKGDHLVYIAARTADASHVVYGQIEKGRLTRRGEGTLCDLLAIETLLSLTIGNRIGSETSFVENCGLASLQMFPPAHGACTWAVIPTPVKSLAQTHSTVFDAPLFWPDGRRGTATDLDPDKHILFPGSFNPKHFGHDAMATQAEAVTGKQAVYAITPTHPDKGDLTDAELLRRAEQFRWHRPVLFTRGDALYVQKAKAFPRFGFLIGVDALLGLLNPKYYGGTAQRDAVLRQIEETGARFHVVGREIDGAFVSPEDVEVPLKYARAFVPLTGRWNVRSRDLR